MVKEMSSAGDGLVKPLPYSNKGCQYKTQIFAALAVSLGPFAAGLSKGYTSPAIASLQDNSTFYNGTTGFTVTNQQASWIASLSLLGGLFGGILGGAAMRMGRKRVLLFLSLPFSMVWFMIIGADNVQIIYASSLVVGFLCAVMSMVAQVYISEAAVPEVRGSLASLQKILNQVGVTISFTAGAYLNWQSLAALVASAPIILFILVIYLPETPSYLLLKNKEKEAKKSLQWLRGQDVDVRPELATIRTNILASKQMSDSRSFFSKKYLSSRLIRPVLITCGLTLFQRFSGAHAFSFYAVTTFSKTLVGMSPHAGAIAVSIVQILASCLSGLLIDYVGRLPLLIASGTLMSVALSGFGSYVYYEEVFRHNSIAESLAARGEYDWIPLTCVLVFTVAFSLGINPISWLLIGELFPLEFRGLGSALSTTFSYLCAFVSVKTFIDFQEAFGLYGAFWLYSAVSICGLLFVLTCVPETKGRKLDEMSPKHIESILITR